MEIFRSRYYNTNRGFLSFLGLWPHDEESRKKVKRVTIIFLVISLIIPQVREVDQDCFESERGREREREREEEREREREICKFSFA